MLSPYVVGLIYLFAVLDADLIVREWRKMIVDESWRHSTGQANRSRKTSLIKQRPPFSNTTPDAILRTFPFTRARLLRLRAITVGRLLKYWRHISQRRDKKCGQCAGVKFVHLQCKNYTVSQTLTANWHSVISISTCFPSTSKTFLFRQSFPDFVLWLYYASVDFVIVLLF